MGNYIPQREWDAINRMEFSPSELRAGELYRQYLFLAARMAIQAAAFTVAGDYDSAAIAHRWLDALKAAKARARSLEVALKDRKRAAKIARRHGRSI
ncbi:MAG: hypothetical protein IPK52_22155 [Chloroflexi bacterium]|nr:hypothetical protein [Chloroflexota bacterium]